MKKYKKGNLLFIKWTDSYSNSRWYSDNEIDLWIKKTEKEKIISIEFLYKQTKKYIVIYGDATPSENARFMKIPIGAVKLIKKLKY